MQIISHIQANCYYYLQNLNYYLVSFGFVLIFIFQIMIIWAKKEKVSIKKYIYVFLISLYIIVFLSITLLGRKKLEDGIFAELDSSFALLLKGNINIIYDMLFNVILFIPAGILLSKKHKIKFSCVAILLLTFLVEIGQMILKLGRFECADIVTNFIGGVIGIGLFHLSKVMYHNIQKRINVKRNK